MLIIAVPFRVAYVKGDERDRVRGLLARTGFGKKGAGGMSTASRGNLVLDVRALDPSLRRAMIFAVVDTCVGLACRDDLILVSDHDPSGIGYQIDLRRETRGRFEFTYGQRQDGAWTALLRRKDTQ